MTPAAAGTPPPATAGSPPPPVDNTPEAFIMPANGAAAKDSAEDITEDSARDLTDNRYYNKPGATRAQYDADWQECRLIARGSMTPGGSYVVVYNPAVISPAAAAGGGLIGGLIASAIVDGQVRRANRRACLMFKGWRVVEVEAETGARYAAMPEAARTAILNEALGAADPKGKSVQSWNNAFAEMPAALADKAVK
ncbi:MAG: hypothetical protein ACOYLS_07035 [Polymorphobacter sp.]